MRNPARTRTCAGCGKKADKSQFIRIGKGADGVADVSEAGRGAYICKERSCLEAAIKRKRIPAILRCAVGQELYDKIFDIIGCDDH